MSFYKSSAWRRKRRKILARDNYECQVCKQEGRYNKGVVVHHIEHLEDRKDLALEDDNLLTVCEACHNRLHPEKLQSDEAISRGQKIPERW